MASQTMSQLVTSLQASNESLNAEITSLRTIIANQRLKIQVLQSVCGPTFTCFPKLPAELRLKIWQCVMQPRFIEINYNEKIGFTGGCNEIDPLPIISKVCRDSREVFLKEYCLYLVKGGRTRPVYVNPEVDTVYLNIAPEGFNAGSWNLGLRLDLLSPFERAVEAFRDHVNHQFGAQIRQTESRGPHRHHWEIRKLALNSHVLSCWENHELYEGGAGGRLIALQNLYILRNFPEIKELLFIALPKLRENRLVPVNFYSRERYSLRKTQYCPTIGVPEHSSEICRWEEATRRIGWLRAVSEVLYPDYPNAIPAKTSVAVGRIRAVTDMRNDRRNRKLVVDERDGLEMFGPMNTSVPWDFWNAGDSAKELLRKRKLVVGPGNIS